MVPRLVWGAVASLSLAWSAEVRAQAGGEPAQPPPAPEAQPAAAPSPDTLGLSFDRIKAALERESPRTLRIKPDQPTFHIRVIEKRKPFMPDFSETLKFSPGPVPNGGPYMYEFLRMVAPPEARPYGAFTNGELAQVALTSILSALAMRGAGSLIEKRRNAERLRTEQTIRGQVDREFEEYLKAHPEAPRPIR